MARNGIYLARAREQIAQQRAENEREHRRRVDDAYRRVPGLRALDQTLQQQMIALVGLTMRHGSDPTEELRALERANLDTQAQRAELLTAYHLPVDYTDDIYTCPRCHDTGYVQGQPCECLLRRYNAELTRDLSRLLQHGDESFEHFDLTLYDENARPKMERVFQVCRSFAQTFRPGTMNLLLQGGTGSNSLDQSMPDFLPDRLEAGTHNVPGVAGLLEGLRFLRRRGIHSLFCHEAALVRQAAEGLAQLPRVQVYSAGEKGCQSGVLSFRVAGRDPGWVAEELGQRGIAVRAGLHCAPLAHATGGTEATGTVRVSFSAFNTGQEVERFLKTMRRLG